jgi:hypothetical protein
MHAPPCREIPAVDSEDRELHTVRLLLVVKLNKIDVLTSAVFCDFQKIHDTRKAGSARQSRRDVIEVNLTQFIHHDITRSKFIFVANLNARPLPDANTAGDLAATYWFSQTLREQHVVRLTNRQKQPPREIAFNRKRCDTIVLKAT